MMPGRRGWRGAGAGLTAVVVAFLAPGAGLAQDEPPEVPDPPAAACAPGPAVLDVPIDETLYPESAAHWKAAIAAGKPAVLTLNRTVADANRAAWQSQVAAEPGYDRDEYPFAATDEGGLDEARSPSVRYISPADNRGSGSVFGAALRGRCDGTRFRIVFVRPPNPFPWEGDWRTDAGGPMSVWLRSPQAAFSRYDEGGRSRLDGRVAGRRLVGDWFGGSGRRGTFAFALTADGASFAGRWAIRGERRTFRGWAGTRQCQTWRAALVVPVAVTVRRRDLRPEDELEIVNRERENESIGLRGRVTWLRNDPAARPVVLAARTQTLRAPAWVRTGAARAVVSVGTNAVEVPPFTEVRLANGPFRVADQRTLTRSGERFLEVVGRFHCPLPDYNGPTVPALSPPTP